MQTAEFITTTTTVSSKPAAAVETTVCHCFSVSESTVRTAIDHKGAKTVEEVTETTCAGGGCMACHCRIQRMLMGLPAKCPGNRFQICGSCGCAEAICECSAA
ncbi:MAG: (2Fe-2S)-binding protein [Verrucomicrobiota bacterium]